MPMRNDAPSRVATARRPAVRLSSTEVGRGLWLLDPVGDLDGVAARALRSACVSALDEGGLSIVLDLTGVRRMSIDTLLVLASVSETLIARGGFLWLAAAGDGAYSYDLLPLDERGLHAARGFCAVLDSALAQIIPN